MKKISISILALAILLPTAVLAFTTPGLGHQSSYSDCIVWRQGMGPGPTEGQPNYNGQGFCTGPDLVNQRLYELELAVIDLQAQNAQLRSQGQVAGSTDSSARIAALEARLSALENKTTSTAIDGCGDRVVGFSVTSGQSCIGNKPAKK